MKTKRLLTILLTFLIVSCSKNKDEFAFLNEKLSNHYQSVVLSVKSTIGEEQLLGRYEAKYSDSVYDVSYEYQTLNEIDINEGNQQRVVTNSGSYNASGNAISDKQGKDSNIPFEVISLNDFSFNANAYESFDIKDTLVVIKVNDLSSILNLEGSYENTYLNVYYSSNIDKIVIETKKDNNEFKLIYEFTY